MIYFDNSATTKIHPQVLETYRKVSEIYFGNPSSLHQKGEDSSALLKQSRQQIADLLKVKPQEVYFTSGGTEGDNWAIQGTAYEKERYGKHLITTTVEHPAVKETMKNLEKRGWDVTYIEVDHQGLVSSEAIKEAIRPDTVLVSVMAVNNEVGAIQPIDEIGQVLKDYPNIHFHVDAVQAIGKIDIDLSARSRIDIAVFSSHKFHGPRGIGFVYLKEGRQLTPLMNGGGQENNKRSGTENLPAIAAMAKALRLLFDEAGKKQETMTEITTYLKDYLIQKKHIRVFTSTNSAPHILCFGIPGIRGEVVVHALEKDQIFISTTSACASRSGAESSTLLAMKVEKSVAESAVRLSLSSINTMDQAKEFINVFDRVYRQFETIL